MKPNSNPVDSVRSRLTGKSSGSPSAPRRSRRDQEAQYQRSFRLAMIGVVALIIVILAGGIVYEYMIKPNQVLAQVNGHEIRRRDYWKYQSVALYQQARTYEAYASQSQAEQQQQFLQFAASFDAQRADVWGSTDVSPTTLQQMVNDQLYLDGAEAMGIELNENDVQTFALNQFAPQEAPLQTPIPEPTMIPERAQMATETAEAQATQQAIAMGTVVATPVAEGTPGASPVANGATPVTDATPIASPVGATPAAATPVTDGAATPGATPPATMTLDDSLNTANAEFDIFQDEVFGDANMNEADYLRLWVKPRFARQLVNSQITSGVPQVAEQVNAQHIMVTTQDLANQLYDQVTNGGDFSAVAISNSTDTSTASTGGQLGWFAPFDVSDTFSEQAFALQPGQTSQPFQDGANWHIVRVNEREDARPLTDAQYTTATNDALDAWITEQQNNADIESDDLTTPTPTAEAFVAPPGAPTPVPPTPIPPTPTPPVIGPELASPVAGSATPVAGTPVASPVVGTPVVDAATPVSDVPAPAGTPVATPVIGTPVASPVASPIASPVASPSATPASTPAG